MDDVEITDESQYSFVYALNGTVVSSILVRATMMHKLYQRFELHELEKSYRDMDHR